MTVSVPAAMLVAVPVIMPMAVVVIPVRGVAQRDDHGAAVADAAFGDHPLGHRPHRPAVALQHGHLHAASVVEMDVQRGQRQLVPVVEGAGRLGTAFLFIAHDLRLVRRFCGRVAVLDGGRLVEERAVTAALDLDHPAACRLRDAMLPPRPAHAGGL